MNFDDYGTVIHRVVLGEECKALEVDAGTWHAVLSLDHGGYQPVAEPDFASWAPAGGEEGITELMRWYAHAPFGNRWLTL